MWAAIVGNPGKKMDHFQRIVILRYLIDQGGDVNKQNLAGNSCLHLSLLEGRFDCAKLLLEESKSDITLRNTHHETPLSLLNSETSRICSFVN